MYQCELISVQYKKGADSSPLEYAKEIGAVLRGEGIERKGVTDVSADPQKIAETACELLINDERDLLIFVNALDSTDHNSFKKLFYRTISHLEASVQTDESRKGITPKLKVNSLGDMGGGYKGYCFNYNGKRFIILPRASLTGKSLSELIESGVKKAEEFYRKNSEDYPKGICCFDKKGEKADPECNREITFKPLTVPRKQGFFRSFIPSKGDTRDSKIRKIIVLVAIVAFLGALGYVLEFFIFAPMRNNAVTSSIQHLGYDTENYDSETDNKDNTMKIDWDKLKKTNKEIVGWIKIPGTKIDYPVLFHKGDDRYNQYYIHRTYEKKTSEYGSIFIDYRSTDSVNSRNVIMHGHDMLDGSMFAGMLKYSPKGDLKGDLDYYKKHPIIFFNTPDGYNKYKIISVFKTSTRYEHGEFFNYMQGDFNSDAEFMNFVYNVRVRSMFDIPVTCNEDDQIITLSTCCYEFYQWRCVIVARKVRENEDDSVDTALATRNPSPLFPDVYYERYGGTRPEEETFKSADKKGLIDWYDGKGDLKGSEELTATLAANPTEPPTEKPKKGQKPPTEPPNYTYYSVVYFSTDLPDDYSEFAAYNVKEGDPVPVPSDHPTKPEDENFTYEFVRWKTDSENLKNVDFKHINTSFSIEPVFKAIPKATAAPPAQ